MPRNTTDTLQSYEDRTAQLVRIARAAAKKRAATTLADREKWRRELDQALDAWQLNEAHCETAVVPVPQPTRPR